MANGRSGDGAWRKREEEHRRDEDCHHNGSERRPSARHVTQPLCLADLVQTQIALVHCGQCIATREVRGRDSLGCELKWLAPQAVKSPPNLSPSAGYEPRVY